MTDSTFGLTVEQPSWDLPGEGDRRRRARARIPALTILYHPDLGRIGERAVLSGLLEGRTAYLSRLEPLFEAPDRGDPLPLEDRHISRSPLHLSRTRETGAVHLATGESRTRVAANGAPVQETWTASGQDVERGVVLELADRVVLLLHTLPATPIRTPERFELVGESEGILRVRREIRRVADLEVPVLLRGETGTGKELVARAIHNASRRRNGPCLCVNMGAIPTSLAVSELFGSARGSFTGSVRDQIGFFQRAHGGTLFLDEIGEAPPEVQVMLLRVLESGEVQRVGGLEPQKVNVRLIAATDADLEQAIAEGRFRAPLLHRLAGYEISIPPLRERRDDFGRLLFHFLRQELQAIGEERRLAPSRDTGSPWMPASVVARLARYGWPGNVRQLLNTVRQIVIASRASEVVEIGPQIEKLLREAAPVTRSPELPEMAARPEPRRRAEPHAYRSPAEVTEAEIVEALRASRWEIKPAAERLGVSRPSLYLLIEKFPSIRKAADLSRAEILEARELYGDLDAAAERLEVSKKGLQQRMKQLGMG
ncbi:MAG TPA: sigma-54 dependent transcriptional regulator [Thermoanaerobaculia bacterium]|jgi:DNA-binding NtrC family response regulator|nr:sigma-54 dependent transcriptional regulator [Thermoanaerobaculia bacterium]